MKRQDKVEDVDEIIRIRDQFYILASSLRTQTETRSLKAGETFAVFDDLADIAITTGAYFAYEQPLDIDWVRGYFVPPIPVLEYPKNADLIGDNRPTFVWSESEGAAWYELQVDDNSSFSSPLVFGGLTETKYALPENISNGIYYWRVGAIDAAWDSSGFSDPFQFTIAGPLRVPSEYATIQEAINSCRIGYRDTVRVAPGTYSGPGNVNLTGFDNKVRLPTGAAHLEPLLCIDVVITNNFKRLANLGFCIAKQSPDPPVRRIAGFIIKSHVGKNVIADLRINTADRYFCVCTVQAAQPEQAD